MAKAYQSVCGEVPGYEGCGFLVRSEHEDEAVRMVQAHAEEVHNETWTPDEIKEILQETNI